MVERLLEAIAKLALARPRSVFAASAVPAVVALLAFGVPVDFSFAGLMDRSHPEVERYFDASQRYGLGGLLPVLLEGPEGQLDEAVDALAAALAGRPEVRSVVADPPEDWLRALAPYRVERSVFDDWVALATDVGRAPDEQRARVAAALDALRGRQSRTHVEGARLVLVTLARDPFELALDANDFPVVRSLVREALAPLGVDASFAGMAAIITQEQEATIERMRWLGPASLALVLLVLLSFERRPLVLASAALPMLLAVGCSLTVVGLAAGELTIMESVFGVLVFGLGVDFAIHLLLRVREERGAGLSFEASVRRAVTGTGRGIAAGALTTGGSFLVLALSPDPVFRRLGLAGGLGLLLCFGLLLLLLPAGLQLRERRSPATVAAGSARAVRSWLSRAAGVSARAPLLVGGLGIVLVAAIGVFSPSPRYETNLERVFSRDIEAVATARRIHERFGVDPGPWLVAARDVAEARELEEAFREAPLFGRAESLASLLAPDTSARYARLAQLLPGLAPRLRGAEGELELLALLAEAARVDPLDFEAGALPAALADRFVGPDGELLVYAFVDEPALDSQVAAQERRAAQAIAPEATSMNVIYEALIGTDRPWMPRIVTALCVFIVFVLVLDFRSLRLACLALLPVVAATLVTVGLSSSLGFAFNTVTLVALPLLLGLGVDDGIHVVHRLLEQPSEPIEGAVGAVGRSIALTTLTTCASVALLLFTRHPGIESLAALLLVGLPLSLIASVTLLPAAAVLLGVPRLAARRARASLEGAAG